MSDKFFVLQKPSHSILSVVVVNGSFPLTTIQHKGLEKLKECSDILFVFSERYHGTRLISKTRFASLYGSNLWMTTKDGFLKGILKTLEYEKEVLKSHTSVVIVNLEDMTKDWWIEKLDNLQKVNMSPITLPILSILRLSAQDFYDVYKRSPLERLIPSYGGTDGMYCSYKDQSLFTFLRPETANILLGFCGSEEFSGFVDSFGDRNFKYFFASIIKYLGLEYVNNEVLDVKI